MTIRKEKRKNASGQRTASAIVSPHTAGGQPVQLCALTQIKIQYCVQKLWCTLPHTHLLTQALIPQKHSHIQTRTYILKCASLYILHQMGNFKRTENWGALQHENSLGIYIDISLKLQLCSDVSLVLFQKREFTFILSIAAEKHSKSKEFE